MPKCMLCGAERKKLFTVRPDGGISATNLKVCESCHYELEADDEPSGSLSSINVEMNSRMLNKLSIQAQIEGFGTVEHYLHSIIFREAAKIWLEDLPDLQTPEEESAFVQGLKDWMKGGGRR